MLSLAAWAKDCETNAPTGSWAVISLARRRSSADRNAGSTRQACASETNAEARASGRPPDSAVRKRSWSDSRGRGSLSGKTSSLKIRR